MARKVYVTRTLITDAEWLKRRARDLEGWYSGKSTLDHQRVHNLRPLLPLLRECLAGGEGVPWTRVVEIVEHKSIQELSGRIGRAIRTGWLVKESQSTGQDFKRSVYYINPYISIELRRKIREE